MNEELWTQVDAYFDQMVVRPDAALRAAVSASEAAGMPAIQVAANQGKLLMLLARLCGARRILEIGTLGGYSTIWLARALPPGGTLITLEYEPKHAEVARRNIAAAGLANVVDLRVGRAIDILPAIARENAGPFDLVFIDADKPSNAEYFGWAVELSRPGSVIVVDNVVRDGEILDSSSTDERIVGTRRLFDAISREPRVCATAIQTVGVKGYDGLAIAIVNGDRS